MRLSMVSLLFALCCGAAQAQDYDLHLIFESPPGVRPAQFTVDSRPELGTTLWPPGIMLTRENEDGFLTGLLIVDPRTREVSWRMTAEDLDALGFTGGIRVATGDVNHDGLPDITGSSGEGGGVFNDVVNLYGDGTRYPVFSGEDRVLVVDPRTNTLAFTVELVNATIASLLDFTGDGTQELLLYLADEKVLQVWDNGEVVDARRRP